MEQFWSEDFPVASIATANMPKWLSIDNKEHSVLVVLFLAIQFIQFSA
jgi:hypothetical protein